MALLSTTWKNHTKGDIAGMTLEERIALIWICEWSVNARISSVGSTILMLADNLADVSREVLKSSYRIEPIFVSLPGEEERRKYIEYLLKDDKVKTDITIDEFAKLSSGLSKKSIKDIKLKSEAEDIPISFEFIKEKKHSVLQKEYGTSSIHMPEIGLDIGEWTRRRTTR